MTGLVLHAEILAIGDELTSGARVDTNSAWLSEQLQELGVAVRFHTTVGDQLADNLVAFQTAAQRASLVLVTGGLGPTADDLTRQVMATVSGQPLVRHPEVIAHIEQLFQRYGRVMPPANVVQADFPATSQIIPNAEGTAPGIDIEINLTAQRSRFFCLPGVPAEMKEMFRDYVAPAIRRSLGQPGVTVHHVIHCFGMGESHIEAMLPDLIHRDRIPRVGITASGAVISLRIAATAASENLCRQQMQPTIDFIRERLGDLIFGCNEDTLEQVVVEKLVQQRRTLAIWDFSLGGQVGAALQQCRSSATQLRGSVYVPAEQYQVWQTQLGTTVDDLQSELIRIARQIRLQWESDVAVVIGPFREDEQRRPSYTTAISNGVVDIQQTHVYSGHRSLVLSRAIKQVLNALRLYLQSH